MSWCVFSSLSFTTNCIAAYLYGEYIYSFLWGSLCVTSVVTHGLRRYANVHTVSYDTPPPTITHQLLFWAFMIDKIVLYLVVISGWCLIYKKIGNIITFDNKSSMDNMYSAFCCLCIVVTFVLTLLLYYYGYVYNMFAFDSDVDVANKWHCMVHWFGSFGHHCILLL